MTRLVPRLAAALVGLVVAGGLWLAFAPAPLGGGARYVIVTGSSMEPGLRDGALSLLRPAGDYGVGDVVGYTDPRLGHVVLHRVVAEDGGRLVTKGDANEFLDPTHPRRADVVGREWVSIPHVGTALGWARDPLPAAILVAGLTLLPLGAGTRRRRGARRPAAAATGAGGPSAGRSARRDLVIGLGVAAVVLGALGVYATLQPSSKQVAVADAYRQSGTFAYSAEADRGATYPDGRVRRGQAVFPALTRAVRVRFDYRLDSALGESVAGRIALAAVVGDGLGWSRALVLTPPRAFDGSRATIDGVLQLDRLQSLVQGFERESGTTATAYTVALQPRVQVQGEVGGVPIRDRFAPALEMRLDATRLAPVSSEDGEGPALEVGRSGAISRTQSARIGVGAVAVSVPVARAIGVLGAQAALALMIILGLPLHHRSRRSPADRIVVRYSDRLVAVARLPQYPPDRVAEVERIEDLVGLAEKLGEPVMAADDGAAMHFGVMSAGDVLYRHTARASSSARGVPPVGAPTPRAPA